MKAIKQDETVWGSSRSQFLQDEMDLEILIQALLNEQDQDFLKFGLNKLK
jgi:hypothetical protein